MFRRMAGGEPRLHPHAAKGEFIPIAHRFMVKPIFRAALGADIQFGLSAQTVHQFARAAEEISMDVGFKHMGDRHAKTPGGLDIDINVRARVYHSADMGGVIAKQVRTLGHAIG